MTTEVPSRIADQEYRIVRVDELEPHPDNPHRGDIERIAESIKRYGFYGLVLIQKSRMRIIAGEHRWRGAIKMGLTKLPAVLLDVDDDTALRILLADNRMAEFGEYDDPKLAEMLQGLDDLGGTGWHDEDLAELLDSLAGDIEVIAEAPAAPRPAAKPAPAAMQVGGKGDDHEEFEAEAFDEPGAAEADETATTPPQPKAGTTVELIVTLTAAQHDEVTELLGHIRARDGEEPLGALVVSALRTHSKR
ncbi:ParB N-terminal domain-containing protein [Nonomuraea endophytica]|uniref:ParB N-terminal domain-containing protein n=1 Tax=Nonomuraea endophytica TaxID=714136 RepID=UPI0037C64C60